MDSAAFFALAASFSWVLSQLFGHKPALYYGSLHFNRLRMIVASFLLVVMIMLNGNSWELAPSEWKWIIISGIVGIGLGDLFYSSLWKDSDHGEQEYYSL